LAQSFIERILNVALDLGTRLIPGASGRQETAHVQHESHGLDQPPGSSSL
jgi:hypothetical protein